MSSSLPSFPSVDSTGGHSGSEFGPRLVKLADGRPGIRGGIHVEIREPDPASSSSSSASASSSVLDFIASDETLDRYDETISAAKVLSVHRFLSCLMINNSQASSSIPRSVPPRLMRRFDQRRVHVC